MTADARVSPDAVADRVALTRAALRSTRGVRRRRWVLVTAALTFLLLVACVLALTLGAAKVSAPQVIAAVLGFGDERSTLVLRTFRLPRLVLALLTGIAFGLAGALFQSVLRNPLASPDIIGISQGASVGAVVALLVLGATGPTVFLLALAGGLLVGGVLYTVAYRGGLAGFRFVLAGIGVAYLASSVLGYLLTRTEVKQAQDALRWLAGSLAQYNWATDTVLALALLVLIPLVALSTRGLRALLLGDDTAAALGVRPDRARLLVIGLGVALASVATAAAGPIAFVAFTAAPIARRLVKDGSLALIPAALVGASMVTIADLVSQYLLPANLSVPVGIVTGVIGGPYLIWLLATGRRTSESST